MRGRGSTDAESKHKCALPPTNTTATRTLHTLATNPKRTGLRRGPRGPAEKTFSKVNALVIDSACGGYCRAGFREWLPVCE